MKIVKSIVRIITCASAVWTVHAQAPIINSHSYLECFQGKCGNLEKTQIWSMTPGNGNYMFFASNEGLGVYDGVRWEINNINDVLRIRSLYFDAKNNTIYCGSVNQFGKWEMNEYGKFQYTSIWKNTQKNAYMEFWRVGSANNDHNIYFQSYQALFRYDTKTQAIDTICTSGNFRYMHVVSGYIYIQDNQKLYKLSVENQLHEMVSIDDRIMNIYRRESDGNLVLFLEHKGIFVLSGDYHSLKALNEATNLTLSKYKIFSVTSHVDGRYLIGTTRGGLFIVNNDGSIENNIGENEGLISSTVLSVVTDNRSNIWMGLDGGVATWDTGESETFFTPKPFIGSIRGIISWNNHIYIGTNQGVFRLDEKSECHPVEGTSGSVWGMYNVQGELVFTHDLGVFHIKNNRPVCIQEGGITTLVQSPVNPACYIGGNYYGLSLYKFSNGSLEYAGALKNYAGTARYMQFDKSGYLWIMLPLEGFVRLTLSLEQLSVEEIKAYPLQSNKKEFMLMTEIDGSPVFYDGNDPYRYDPGNETFVTAPDIAELFKLCGKNLTFFKQFEHIFWYQTKDDIGYILRKGNSFEKHAGIFSRVYNKRISPFMTHLGVNTYVAGFQNGIALYELNGNKSNTLGIRILEAFGVGEPVYYNFRQVSMKLPNNKRFIHIYPVNMNPDYCIEYRIKEIDNEWKREKIDNYLTLTNLESGTYTIQIRNAGDTEVEPVQVLIEISRPWYISSLMIGVYLFILLGFVVLIAWFFERKFEKENLIQAQQITELEKENLQIELDEKNKRLAFITMNGVKRNNLMNELRNDINNINQQELQTENRQKIKNVVRKIEFELNSNDDWEIFEKYFNVVFGGLLEKLTVKYPQLTHGDLKLLAYLKLNLNNKEIANLLNISYRSVEVAKYRLRKKLNLETNDNFNSILNEEEKQ